MQHLILRCKHCQREYTYCTYGNGPEYGTEEGCSMDYCAECQKAIDKALSKIPVRFQGKFKEINEPRLIPLFDKIKSACDEKRKSPDGIEWPALTQIMCCGDYDNSYKYTHEGITYRVEYNDDTPDEKHISVEMEYDIKNKKFTGNLWKGEYKDSYLHGRNTSRDWERKFRKLTKIEPCPMSEPIGKLFFLDFDHGNNDFEWDVVANRQTPKKKKEHELHSYTIVREGWQIKSDVEHGYACDRSKVVLVGFTSDSLIDFIKYELTVESYEDENIVYFKDIHCV